MIEKGLESGSTIYVIPPEDPKSFKLVGDELVSIIHERNKAKKIENEKYRKLI